MGLNSTNEVRRLREGLSETQDTADKFRLLSEVGRHCVEEILAGEDRGLARIGIGMLLSEESDGKPFFSNKDIVFINYFIDDGLEVADESLELSAAENVKGGIKMCERPMAEWVCEDDVGDERLAGGEDEDGEEGLQEEPYVDTGVRPWPPDFVGIFCCAAKKIDK